MVTFDDYTIDLSQFMHAVSAIKRPRERTTAQLMRPTRRIKPIQPCLAIFAANCSTAWPARSTLLQAVSSLLRRLERRGQLVRDEAFRSQERYSRLPACACLGLQPRPSPSAYRPPPSSCGPFRSPLAWVLWR